MACKSLLHDSDLVENTERKFGSARHYLLAYYRVNGELRPLLFTDEQLIEAGLRADKNPEDIRPRPFFSRVMDWLLA